jgi:hypothetical protein
VAGLTLAEARTLVSQFLDDPNSRRWTTAQIDVALQQALTGCLTDYTSEGGSQFDVEAVVTSSGAGLADLTSLTPILKIVGVQYATGAGTGLTFYRVEPLRRLDREWIENASWTLYINHVRDYVLPTTTTHPLVGNGLTAAPTWPAFDRWVCAEAAMQLGVKDNDQRPGLERLAQAARISALGKSNSPRSYPLSLPRGQRATLRQLSYVFTPSTTAPSLQLVRARGEW